MEQPIELQVAFGKRSAPVRLPAGATAADLSRALVDAFGVAPASIKLFAPGVKAALHPAQLGEQTLEQTGIRPGARLKMMASSQASMAAVQAAHEDGRMRGFEQDLRRSLQRAGAAPGGGGGQVQLPAGPHTFQRFEAWQRPGLSPPPSEALKLLHRLAADPGIAGVMGKHKWAVGLLSEMPPEGKVGVSPVCILGVNINRGQEISLRLRTDDLRGFRRYDRIRETLIHELAHMVHGDHDNAFKELNSQLRRECDAFDWRGPAARSLDGAAFEGTLQYDLPPERQTVMQQTAASSGQTLRQLASPGAAAAAAEVPADARQAAAAAALRRSGAAPPAAGAGPGSTQQQQQQFSKGQAVLYRTREGDWQEAKVVAVDQSLQPPSYTIELGGNHRETEGSRLLPLPPQPEAVQGLGHRDEATEEKEAAVRRLEE